MPIWQGGWESGLDRLPGRAIQSIDKQQIGDEMQGVYLGDVTHFYNHISVAVLDLKETIRLGDEVQILGYTTDFRQRVTSLQIEHHPVTEAKPGQDVAMLVRERVREGDRVYKVAT